MWGGYALLKRGAVVAAWQDSFLKLDFRWKILVLCADSASGKSNFAEHLFDNPFIVTVEGVQHLDLKGLRHDRHDGLVLDNVNSWGQLLQWRAVLQARNSKSKGGQSATNAYAYEQYLFSMAVVATIDLDTPDAYLVDDGSPDKSNWLMRNCTVLRLRPGDAFYDKSLVPRKVLPNRFGLYAATIKRRRSAAGAADAAPAAAPLAVTLPCRSEGPPVDFWDDLGDAGVEEDPFGHSFGLDEP